MIILEKRFCEKELSFKYNFLIPPAIKGSSFLFYGIILDFNKKVFDKRVLNQKVWLGLLALNGVFLNAFEYQISARVGSFSRIAFNQSVINSKKGIYPTGSYITTTGALQVDSSLLPKGIENHKLGFGVGGEIGSLAYDSTKFLIDEANLRQGFSQRTGIIWGDGRAI
ncbi:hypothetical protein VN1242_00850 [Helicobacter pylori]